MEFEYISTKIRYAETIPYPSGRWTDVRIKAYDCRIFYVLDGRFSMVIDGRTCRLTKNDFVFIPPAVEYMFGDNESENTKIVIINADVENPNFGVETARSPDDTDLFDDAAVISRPKTPPFSIPFVAEKSDSIAGKITEIYTEFRLCAQGYEDIANALLKTVLIYVVRSVNDRHFMLPVTVKKLVDYIHTNYASEITADMLKNRFHYHPYYLNSVFLKYMGTTIHKYLMEQRVHASCSLMLTSDMTFQEIAVAVGFCNQSHFSKIFRRFTGMTPGEYRQTNSKIHI